MDSAASFRVSVSPMITYVKSSFVNTHNIRVVNTRVFATEVSSKGFWC